MYHAWDESKEQLWANKETGCSPHFWGRAMGWYCMAILDVLDYIPTTGFETGRNKLIEIVNKIIPPVINYQDKETGLWYQVLD